MILLITLLSIFSINCIQQNLGLNIVKVQLSKQISIYPPLIHNRGVIDRELLNFKIENIILPVFQNSERILSRETTKKFISEGKNNWQIDKNGRYRPPWFPQEFDNSYLAILTEEDKTLIESNSKAYYEGQLRIGNLESKYTVGFSLNFNENIILSPECENCSKISTKDLYDCSKSASCEIIEQNIKFDHFTADRCRTLLYFKKYEIIEDAPIVLEFLLVKQSSIKFENAGLISLKANSKLGAELLEKKLVNQNEFGIHYQSDLVNEDLSFLILGGIEEHYRDEDFTYIPAKITDDNYQICFDGIILQINEVKTKTLYGLQKYSVVFDESNLFIRLPLSLLKSLTDIFYELDINCYIDRELTPGILVCDTEYDKLPLVTFVNQGKEITILPSIYGGTCKLIKDATLCFTRFAVSLDDKIILGEPLFVNYFVLFDNEKSQIGFSRPKTQKIVDWSIFDNGIAFLLLLIVSGGLILTGIICIRVNSRSRDVPFQNFNDDMNKSRKVNIELKK